MHGNHPCHRCGNPLTPFNLSKVLVLGVVEEIEQMVELHSIHGSFLAHSLGALYLGFRASRDYFQPSMLQRGVSILLGLKVLITVIKLGFRNLYLRQVHEEVGQTGPMTVVSDLLGILWSITLITSQSSRRTSSSVGIILLQGSLLLVPACRLWYSWVYMGVQWTLPRNRGQLLSFLVLVIEQGYRVVPLVCSNLGLITTPVIPVVLLMELVEELSQTLVVTVHCFREPRIQSWSMILINGLILGITHMTRAQILISHSDNNYLVCADRSWYGSIKTVIYLAHRNLY